MRNIQVSFINQSNSGCFEMQAEPFGSHLGDPFQGAGLFEKVCGSGYQAEFLWTFHFCDGLLVHFNDGGIVSPGRLAEWEL